MEQTPRARARIPRDSTYTCFPAVTGVASADNCAPGEQPQLVQGVQHVTNPAKNPSLTRKPMGPK